MEITYPLFNRVFMLNLYKANDEEVELLEKKDFDASTNYIKIPFLNYAIVFIKKEFVDVTFVKNGNSYRAIIKNVVDFPLTFIENPVTIITTASDSDYAFSSVVGVLRNLKGITQVDLDRSNVIENTRLTLQIIAIGRYK